MDRDLIRLECLKIAATRTPDQQDIMARAREFEAYIDEEEKIAQNAAPTSASVTAGKDGKRPAKG